MREKGVEPMGESKILIEKIKEGSIADEIGLEPGDELLAINGEKPRDLIDYRFMCADEELEIEVLKKNDEVWSCEIEKEYDEDLGLGFASDTFEGIRSCANKCVFCFVDQMPTKLRDSLYIKDDDYRMSFLHGNFVTLTNLSKADFNRIITMRLSPIYISVHSTNPEFRVKLLGNKQAGKIMEQLTELAQAGIEMHTQIVLCPELNDGQELLRTISDLTGLRPQIKSIAIVPVGLTGYRQNLFELRKFTPVEAESLVEYTHRMQEEFLKKFRTPLVYLADEFYILAKRDFPLADFYGDFPQLENGVGLVRIFYDSFDEMKSLLPNVVQKEFRIALVTGLSGAYVLKEIAAVLNRIKNLHVELIAVNNEFFGGHVSVAGLLTGQDVINSLREHTSREHTSREHTSRENASQENASRENASQENTSQESITRKSTSFDLILLPSVMCKSDEQVFLDGKTPEDIRNEIGTPVEVVNINEGANDLIEIIACVDRGGSNCG